MTTLLAPVLETLLEFVPVLVVMISPSFDSFLFCLVLTSTEESLISFYKANLAQKLMDDRSRVCFLQDGEHH